MSAPRCLLRAEPCPLCVAAYQDGWNDALHSRDADADRAASDERAAVVRFLLAVADAAAKAEKTPETAYADGSIIGAVTALATHIERGDHR